MIGLPDKSTCYIHWLRISVCHLVLRGISLNSSSIGQAIEILPKFTYTDMQLLGLTSFAVLPCCCSVTKSGLTLFDPMDYSMPGSSVLHYLPEFAQMCSFVCVHENVSGFPLYFCSRISLFSIHFSIIFIYPFLLNNLPLVYFLANMYNFNILFHDCAIFIGANIIM